MKLTTAILINSRRLSTVSTPVANVPRKSQLNRAVTEAEKIVGYPTSFLNLRWLLTDEIANIAMHLRKLVNMDHPLIHTARRLFMDSSSTPPWGLIVLLISKAAGLNSDFPRNERDLTAGVLHSQRVLAEVVEMIRTSNVLHKSLCNLDKKRQQETKDLFFGNKIALLSGDYLLSCSFRELAHIRNQGLNELMSSSLRDLTEAEFVGPRDNQNMPLPTKPVNLETDLIVPHHFDTRPYNISTFLGNPRAEWVIRNVLAGASLLGKSCQGALKLAKHSEETQQLGYLFGKYVALSCQAQVELEALESSGSEPFSLISAPIMLHLEGEPGLYEKIESGKEDVQKVDYEGLREAVCNGDGLRKTKELQRELSTEALGVLGRWPESDARLALQNIINTML